MKHTFCLLLGVYGCLCVAAAEKSAPDHGAENAKIEFLLKAMQMSKLTFLRGGKEYNGEQAEEHLRAKWKVADERVRTARDFIALCATRSETSGTAYEVVLADKKTRMSSAAWMETVLAAHELTVASLDANGRTGGAGKVDQERVKALFARLGDEDFAVREKATADLIRMGPAVSELLTKLEKETKDPEVAQRCVKIREALEDLDQTAMGVLRYIEQSGGRFFRPGGSRTNYDGPGFSAHLQGKALLFSFSLTRPAKEFIEKIAGKSSLHSRNYRVRLADGTEMDVKAWLGKRFRLE